MKKAILCGVVLLGICFLYGCKSNSTSATTELTGDLTGDVTVYDENCNKLTNRSGVKVEAEGTSFSALTDSNGAWTISGLPAGIYSIAFSKSGYDTTKNTSYQFVGGGTGYFGRTGITQIPPYIPNLTAIRLTDSTIIKHDSIATIQRDTVHNTFDTIYYQNDSTIIAAVAGISGKFSNVSGTRKELLALIYFSTDPSISLDNLPYNVYTIGISTPSSKVDFFQQIRVSDFYSYGFNSGDKIYAIAYSSDCYTSNYFDVKTRKLIHIGYGKTPSNVISFTLP